MKGETVGVRYKTSKDGEWQKEIMDNVTLDDLYIIMWRRGAVEWEYRLYPALTNRRTLDES